MPSIRLSTIALLAVVLFASAICGNAPAASPYDETPEMERLVREVGALDPAIISVRPARTKELTAGGYEIQWMPAITLKKGTSFAYQKKLARKMADYVVKFQGGVKTKEVHGGILSFFEGDGWYPRIGNVSYKIVKRKPMRIEVWTQYQHPNQHGTATCCDAGELIGTIRGKNFVPAGEGTR